MDIIDSTFLNNTALTMGDSTAQQGVGGSIFYHCDLDERDCQLTFSGDNSFKFNWADVRGGAINWETNEPLIEGDMEFRNNTAIRYGDDIACYASGLIQLTEEEYYYHLYLIGEY